uniref:Uncharacterized protein n=1 Tax=Anguilla anguilla TaxID=7936 RepID=A0A0E9U8J3_ANGAN
MIKKKQQYSYNKRNGSCLQVWQQSYFRIKLSSTFSSESSVLCILSTSYKN